MQMSEGVLSLLVEADDVISEMVDFHVLQTPVFSYVLGLGFLRKVEGLVLKPVPRSIQGNRRFNLTFGKVDLACLKMAPVTVKTDPVKTDPVSQVSSQSSVQLDF